MKAPDWDRLLELVERARALPEEERDGSLVRACGGDPALLADARSILAGDPPEVFVDPPPGAAIDQLFGGGLEDAQLGDFELRREIGRGGMGVVYLARQRGLGREVAVKVLPRARRGDPGTAERFLREMHAASSLDHPALVGVLASGEADGLLWFAMPYVAGHDLHEELARQRRWRAGERDVGELLLPPFGAEGYARTVVERIAEVAEGLHRAHDLGVLHRDVTPRNLLVGEDGRLRLADFGLAKVLDLETITRESQIQGTPHYMSPEQARALRDPVTPRSDVYSLCVVLFELLSLARPFEGASSREVLDRIASGTHLALRRANTRVPRDLAIVCEKGMAHRPAERYASAALLAEDLRRFLRHDAIAARPPSPLARLLRWTRRNPLVAAAAAVLVLAGLASWGTGSALARAERRVRWREGIERAVVAQSWTPALAAGARAAAAEARAAGELRELVEAFERRAVEDAEQRMEPIDALLALGRGGFPVSSPAGTYLAPLREAEIFLAQMQAAEALALHPEDPRFAAIASGKSGLPWVAVELAPETATVGATGPARATAYLCDPFTGEFTQTVEFGELPAQRALPPGDWRIVVELPGVGFVELERGLRYGAERVRLSAFVRPAGAVEIGMRRIPAVELTLDSPPEHGCSQVLEHATVAEFLVDEAEVSNREYLDFLAATGHAPPARWRHEGFEHATSDWRVLAGAAGDRFLDMPAVAMSVADMRAFAEWAGKRLLTHFELEYVLRGPGMEIAQQQGSFVSLNLGPDSPNDASAAWRSYLDTALPVRDPGHLQPPFDLYHILGNVIETSSSRPTMRSEGRVVVLAHEIVTMGGEWNSPRAEADYRHHGLVREEEHLASPGRGFRCARSAEPDPR